MLRENTGKKGSSGMKCLSGESKIHSEDKNIETNDTTHFRRNKIGPEYPTKYISELYVNNNDQNSNDANSFKNGIEHSENKNYHISGRNARNNKSCEESKEAVINNKSCEENRDSSIKESDSIICLDASFNNSELRDTHHNLKEDSIICIDGSSNCNDHIDSDSIYVLYDDHGFTSNNESKNVEKEFTPSIETSSKISTNFDDNEYNNSRRICDEHSAFRRNIILEDSNNLSTNSYRVSSYSSINNREIHNIEFSNTRTFNTENEDIYRENEDIYSENESSYTENEGIYRRNRESIYRGNLEDEDRGIYRENVEDDDNEIIYRWMESIYRRNRESSYRRNRESIYRGNLEDEDRQSSYRRNYRRNRESIYRGNLEDEDSNYGENLINNFNNEIYISRYREIYNINDMENRGSNNYRDDYINSNRPYNAMDDNNNLNDDIRIIENFHNILLHNSSSVENNRNINHHRLVVIDRFLTRLTSGLRNRNLRNLETYNIDNYIDKILKYPLQRKYFTRLFYLIKQRNVKLKEDDPYDGNIRTSYICNYIFHKYENILFKLINGKCKSMNSLLNKLIALLSDLNYQEISYLDYLIFNYESSLLKNKIEFKNFFKIIYELFYKQKYKNFFYTIKYADLITCNDKSCIICFEHFANKDPCCVLKCFHVFHEKCIINWIKRSFNCPKCRAET